MSAPAVASLADGRRSSRGSAKAGEANARVRGAARRRRRPARRVNPPGSRSRPLHQAPGPRRRARGEIYVSWSSMQAEAGGHALRLRPPAVALARRRPALRGSTLRVNDDTPICHCFEGLAVAPTAPCWSPGSTAATARERRRPTSRASSTRAARRATVRLDGDTVRLLPRRLATGPGRVAVSGATFFPATCATWCSASPRRGSHVRDAHAGPRRRLEDHRVPASWRAGRARPPRPLYAAWYTEGPAGCPHLFATAPDGRRFGAARAVAHVGGSSRPPAARRRARRRSLSRGKTRPPCGARAMRATPTAAARSGRCRVLSRRSRRGPRTCARPAASSSSPGTRSVSHR